MKEVKKAKIEAWCIISKKTGKISVTNYGSLDNPVLDVYPMTKGGEKNALGSFDGYHEVVMCEIKVIGVHKCDCEYCNRKHWTVRKKEE